MLRLQIVFIRSVMSTQDASLDVLYNRKEVDLTKEQIRDCHEEKIHLCGNIQASMGCLLVVKEPREAQLVCFASGMCTYNLCQHELFCYINFSICSLGPMYIENTPDVLGTENDIFSGTLSVDKLFGSDVSDAVTKFYLSPRPFIMRTTPLLFLSMHKLDDYIVIEAEQKVIRYQNSYVLSLPPYSYV